MIVVLGVMILVHEFGHYAAAKLLGVRVEQFAIGFGKRLIGFRRGGTDYRINALPLGGYVKMAGESPLEGRTGAPDEFQSHPRWHRFLIALAGPFMNMVLAVGLLTGVYMMHYAHPAYLDQPAVVGYVVPDSPAAKAGIHEGDRIVRIDKDQNPTWEDVGLKLALSSGHPVNLAVQRGNDILDVNVTPGAENPPSSRSDIFSDVGLVHDSPITVTQVERGMPAAEAGMKSGDVVVAINGRPLHNIEALFDYLKVNQGKPAAVTILRDGQQFNLDITPAFKEKENRYRLGFGFTEPMRSAKLSFPRAFAQSVETNKKYSVLIVELVQKMVQRKVSMKQVVGPIGIGAAAGQAARQPGWTPLMELSAMISLNLGIFNLLPIPILDGGLILLLFVEGIMRRDISQQVKERVYQAAFVFLVLFGIIVIYNDVMRELPGLASRLP